MDSIRVKGGVPLVGDIKISGAKNAALPLLTAALLTDQPFVLHNIPDLADIQSMYALLAQHGVNVAHDASQKMVTLTASSVHNTTAPYEIVRKMRASILVLGPLLARFGKARVSLPGGCAIGTRPVDIHLDGLQQLGAQIDIEAGYIVASAPQGLTGTDITMPLVSVTATENLMMAASLASGQTRLINAAQEPEIVDLANCLRAMGAQIQGDGTHTIVIEGVSTLSGAQHHVIADRIEAGTYAVAAAMTRGDLRLHGAQLGCLPTVATVLQKAGATLEPFEGGIRIIGSDVITGVDILTEPFPGFATDLQAQLMALMTISNGAAMITETIFENRFMHVPELCRMGANITIHGSSALVRGVPQLRGAEVMATDLRASVSLVLAGLAAEGETVINRVYHLDRGYEQVEEKLRGCGAQIERCTGAILHH